MNKKVLFLTLILASTALAGCGKSKPSSEAAPSSKKPQDNGVPSEMILPEAGADEEEFVPEQSYPDEMLVNHRIASILEGEECELRALDIYNYNPNLSFTSADPAVATVDEKGLLKGIAAGETVVTIADKDNPDFKAEIPVIVSEEIDALDAADLAADFNEVDESGLTKIVDLEMYEKSIYRVQKATEEGQEDVLTLLSYDRFDQRMSASYDDAYLRIWETDAEVRVEDGATDFTNYEWIFNTNRFYDTYIYHQTGDVKTYFPVATQSYMGKDRTEPLLDILDNLFRSGKSIFENTFKNCRLSDFTDLITSEYDNVDDKFYGSNGEGDMLFGCTLLFDDETADQDTETNYGIPFGTPTPATQAMRYAVKDNKVISLNIHLVEDYTIDGVDYREIYEIDHKFEEFTDESLYLPNRKDYTLVGSLFEI